MKTKSQEKSNSFRAPLLELVIVIGIFAIVSVYLLRMFMSADKLQGKAVATTKALIRAESIAESENQLGDIVIYYNKNWEETAEPSAYTLTYHLDSPVWENDHFTTVYVEGYVKVTSSDGKETYCNLPIVREINDVLAVPDGLLSEIKNDLGGGYEE